MKKRRWSPLKIVLLVVGLLLALAVLTVVTGFAVLFLYFWFTLPDPAVEADPIQDVLNAGGLGIDPNDIFGPPDELDFFAAEALNSTFNPEDAAKVLTPPIRGPKVHALVYGDGDGGSIVSFQENFGSANGTLMIDMIIGRPEEIKSRYVEKKRIGLEHHTLLRNETVFSGENVTETYLFRISEGHFEGYVSYRDNMLINVMKIRDNITNQTTANFEDIIWSISSQADDVYDNYFRGIAESDVLDNPPS